jgi:hypothetical protein
VTKTKRLKYVSGLSVPNAIKRFGHISTMNMFILAVEVNDFVKIYWMLEQKAIQINPLDYRRQG